MKKKALIIAYNGLSKVGGVQNVIYQTILSLFDEFDFDVVVFNDDDYYLKKLRQKNISCVNTIRVSFPRKYNLFGASSRQYYMYKFAKKIFSKTEYDVVHSFKELDSWPFLKAAKKAGVPVRIIHNNVVHSFKFNNFHSKNRLINSKKKTLKYATSFVAASKHCGDILYGSKNYSIIYNTFDSSEYYIDNQKLSYLSIVQVGIFCENKNQLFTLDVFEEIRKNRKDSFLTFIGYEVEPNYLNRMIEKINKENLTESVKIIDGRNEDAAKYVRQSSCLLVPSYFEGASIVAIEAQACGIPVFASTNVSNELNCGGLIRNNISRDNSKIVWSKVILDTFKEDVNQKRRYDLKRFLFETFKEKIGELYKR